MDEIEFHAKALYVPNDPQLTLHDELRFCPPDLSTPDSAFSLQIPEEAVAGGERKTMSRVDQNSLQI